MPDKKLGQHFLLDEKILRKLAGFIKEKGHFLEIGPGKGSLTRMLASKGRFILAIEKDSSMAEYLNAQSIVNFKLIIGDFLKFDFGFYKKRFTVAGNIPYYISTKILWHIFQNQRYVKKAYLMFQKEFALKVLAGPGSSSYGYISVASNVFFCPRKLMLVKGRSFYPPAKSDSLFVGFSRKQLSFPHKYNRDFLVFLKAVFQRRKKKIKRILTEIAGEKALEVLEKAGIAPDTRPHYIYPRQFLDLFCNIKKQIHPGRS